MNILCETKEELKKVLEKLEKDGYTWFSGHPAKWGENLSTPVGIITDFYDRTLLFMNNPMKAFTIAPNEFINANEFLGNTALITEKEGEATGEILIDKAEYDKAVIDTIQEMGSDPELEGVARLMVPLVGALFANKVKNRLFKEDKHNGSK